MFCRNCGAQIDDKAAICPHCGVAQNTRPEESNSLAIIGFILAFFIPIVGLICSILGLKKSRELGGKEYGLAVAGLIISISFIWVAIVLVCLI